MLTMYEAGGDVIKEFSFVGHKEGLLEFSFLLNAGSWLNTSSEEVMFEEFKPVTILSNGTEVIEASSIYFGEKKVLSLEVLDSFSYVIDGILVKDLGVLIMEFCKEVLEL